MTNAIAGIWFGWMIAEMVKYRIGLTTAEYCYTTCVGYSIFTAIILIVIHLEINK